MQRGVVAQAAHAGIAFTDAFERQAEGRLHEAPHHDGGGQAHGQHEVVERRRVAQQVGPRTAAQAVLAARHRRPALAHTPDDHAQRQREQQEVLPAGAHRQPGIDHGNSQRASHAERKCQPGTAARCRHRIHDDVGGGAEDCTVTQRCSPGVAGQDIDRHRQQRVDEGQRGQACQVARDDRRDQGQQDDSSGDEDRFGNSFHAASFRRAGRTGRAGGTPAAAPSVRK